MLAKLKTLKETADYLRVTRWTVYQLLKSGELEGNKVGCTWRFTDKQILKCLTQGGRK